MRAYMVVREGMVDDVDMVDQSVKTLFASGLFSDVTIRRSEGGLVVSVVENPIVNRVSFEGNGAINDDTLTKEAELRPRQIYTRARVQDDVERFIEITRRAVISPRVSSQRSFNCRKTVSMSFLKSMKARSRASGQLISSAIKHLTMTVCAKKLLLRRRAGGGFSLRRTIMTPIG